MSDSAGRKVTSHEFVTCVAGKHGRETAHQTDVKHCYDCGQPRAAHEPPAEPKLEEHCEGGPNGHEYETVIEQIGDKPLPLGHEFTQWVEKPNYVWCMAQIPDGPGYLRICRQTKEAHEPAEREPKPFLDLLVAAKACLPYFDLMWPPEDSTGTRVRLREALRTAIESVERNS